MLVAVEVVCGIGRIDFRVNISSIGLFDSVISGKDDVVEDVIKGSIEDSESVSGRSLKLRLNTVLTIGIR